MASKAKKTVMLSVGFEAEKNSLQKISQTIENLGKKELTGRGKSFSSNIAGSFKDAEKSAKSLFKQLEKPLISRNQVKELGSNLEETFNSLDRKMLSMQGTLSRVMSSGGNLDNIKSIKALDKEIQHLISDYEEVVKLQKEIKGLGNKGDLVKSQSRITRSLKGLGKKKDGLTKDEKYEQAALAKELQKVNAALEKRQKLESNIAKIHGRSGSSTQGELKNLTVSKIGEKRLLEENTLSGLDNSRLISTLDGIRRSLSGLKDISRQTSINMVDDFDRETEAVRKAEEQSQTFKSVLQTLGIGFSLEWMVSELKEVVRYSFEYMKNLDAALTEISVVSGKTRQEALALTDTFIELSARTGMAIDDIAQASTIFYQQGLNDEAVKKLTEYTAIFAKISNETVETAADQLTAALNGFNYSADQVGEVVDKMSVLAAYSAADINELATAMSKGASAASQAGLSFDEYNAYLATMIEATREAPENIGTSLKTIMARFQQIKKDGTTEDGDTDVNAVETALKSVGVSLRDSSNQLRDLGTVLGELGPKWATLDRNTQAYLGTIIAGTRQQSRFISMMQHWDRVLELVDASENSSGAAMQMHSRAMQGLEADLQSLTNAWQKLISSITSSDFVKTLVKAGTAIIKGLSKGNAVLNILTAAILLLDLRTIALNVKLAKQGKEVKNLNTTWKGLKDSILGSINVLVKAGTQVDSQTTKIKANSAAVRDNTQAILENNAAVKGEAMPVVSAHGKKLQKGGIGQGSIKTTGLNAASLSAMKTQSPQGGAGVGSSAATGLKGAIGMLGNVQILISTAVLAAEALMLLSEGISFLYKKAIGWDVNIEKAKEAESKSLNKLNEQTNLIRESESAIKAYSELSQKMNKSTEEIQKMTDVTAKLSEIMPEVVIGYDSMGQAIIDISKAQTQVDKIKKDRVKQAKSHIGKVAALNNAEISERAIANYKESNAAKWHKGGTAAGIGAGAVGGALLVKAGLTAGAAIPPLGIALAIIGGLTVGISAIAKESKISKERLQELQKTLGKTFSPENVNKIQQDLAIITGSKISDAKYDGITRKDREIVMSAASEEWMGQRSSEIYQQSIENGKGGKWAKKQLDTLGDEWEKNIRELNEIELSTAIGKMKELSITAGKETYSVIGDSIDKVLQTELNITEGDPLYNSLKEAFYYAAYDGTNLGVNNIIKDIDSRIITATGASKERLQDMRDEVANNMTSEEASMYNKTGLFDNAKLFDAYYSSYGKETTEAGDVSETNGILNIINNLNELKNRSGELGKAAADAYAKAWNQLPASIEPTWVELFDQYEKFTERTDTVQRTLQDLQDGEGMGYDQFKEMATLFDNIDTSYFSPEQVTQYGDALSSMADNLTVVNGEIRVNEKALKDVGDLEEIVAESKVESVRKQLEVMKAENEAKRGVVAAELKYMKTQLAVAESVVNGTYQEEEANAKLAEAKADFTEDARRAASIFLKNEVVVANGYSKTWNTAFDKVADDWNKMMTGMTKGEKITIKEFKETKDSFLKELSPSTAEKDEYNFSKFYKEGNTGAAQNAVDKLKANIKSAEAQISAYDVAIGNIDLKLAIVNTGLRKNADGYGKAGKALEDYLTKLEKYLRLLRHIEREEANLKIAEKLEKMQTKGSVLSRMGDRLRYVSHLIGDMKELYNNYEKDANESAADIRKGFGDMVTFNEWGNYDVDKSKYNKLSDEKKKLLDETLAGYKKLIEARDKYYGSYLDYIEQKKKINQEYVQKYIDAENKLVEAIKKREKDILDNKLAAIDKEIKAIDKAAEVRRKAREKEKNAEEMSSMQTDLQRALMDSSGASATQILEMQKKIKDKQQSMADESFDNMVNDMKNELNEEKKLEQDMFNERLEEMDWYWDEADRIMTEGTDSILDTMELYTEEFNKASELQQTELLRGWENTFTQATLIGKDGAKKYQQTVKELQEESNKLTVDENIITEQTKNTAFVSRPKTEEDNPKPVSRPTGGKIRYPGGNSSIDKKEEQTDKNKDTYKPTAEIKPFDPSKYSSFNVGDKVRSKEQVRDGGLNWVQSYSGIENKKVKKGTVVPGWPSWVSTLSAKKGDTEIVKKSYVDGTWYYLLKGYEKNKNWFSGHQLTYKKGGMSYTTGPAWLDGTRTQPEAVLNALQTKAFLQFTNDLSALRRVGSATTASNVNIDNISFNVESMSSVADGEKAFGAFVDKFKEIGRKQGLSILGTANIK